MKLLNLWEKTKLSSAVEKYWTFLLSLSPIDFRGLDQLDQESLPLDNRFHKPSSNLTGQGVNVYVMDTARYNIWSQGISLASRAEYSGC